MVEVKTQYTLETYREYSWFCLFRGRYYRYHKIIFPLVTVLMFFLTYCAFAWSFDMISKVFTCIFSAICILFYIWAITRPKAYVKRSPALFETAQEFVFDSDCFTSLQTGDIASGTGMMRYEALQKVYETKTMFYLFITPVQALLISKSDITKGTSEDLRDILQANVPKKKYVICK